ncbi:MAG TPA: LemA family protein [Egibacteraceae bacterium]|nr:LemA family protein [Egibacteraceae bacterium]
MIGWVILGVAAAVMAFMVLAHNRFVRTRQHMRESWSGIDVELRRRYDLIPNLVETVKGYAAHERGLFESVAEARAAAAANTGEHAGQIRDEQRLVERLAQLLAVAEGYPQLRASEQFLALHRQLAETEDRLAAIRRLHNANVREWNTLGETVPWRLLRGTAEWVREPFFEVDEVARRVPSVSGEAQDEPATYFGTAPG